MFERAGYEMQDTRNNFIKYANAVPLRTIFGGKNMQNVRLKLSKDKTSFLTSGQILLNFLSKFRV